MANISDILNAFSDYFFQEAGVRKYINSSSSIGDAFYMFLFISVILFFTIYFMWPSIKKMILDKRLISFIFFYKNLELEEKKYIKKLASKYKILPFYNILIFKKTYDECVRAELKRLMMNQEAESVIKNFAFIRDSIDKKLFG
ncbi:MAG: hypothetical protein M0R46_05615 [Candidatus Muirbacterium halophilum]|nr:hypothetical protein [Candidatus Muirbacterium halophilum]MCK9475373.1 hypothetical protein [Candidatus Muirbacterium halophilum]